MSNRLEQENHQRDAEFSKSLHGKNVTDSKGLMAFFKKDNSAQGAAIDQYFKHFDNKNAADETDEDREVSIAASRWRVWAGGACLSLV